ncbi:MAG: hypothetical protein ACUVV4_07460 [Candidatus Bathyarchaeia archaeon]
MKSIGAIIGYLASAFLIVLGLIFAWAASTQAASTRLPIAILMISLGFGIIYLIQRRQPSQVVQRVEVSGELKAKAIQCPFCSASLDPSLIRIVDGVPTIKCNYCGNQFQIVEEPKW